MSDDETQSDPQTLRNLATVLSDPSAAQLGTRLKKVGKTLDDYLDLCQSGGLRDDVIAASIDRYLVPEFPAIVRAISQAASDGNQKAMDQALGLLNRVSAMLNQYSKSKTELHLHFQKMSPDQLMEEGEYQVEAYLEMLVRLPGGKQRVQNMFESVMSLSGITAPQEPLQIEGEVK